MLLTILLTILIFGVIITIHELGHFCAARAFGVNILEFSIGMGPKLTSLKRKKPPKPGKIRTLYTIRLLPIGGYVQMEGEETPQEGENSYSQKRPWQRLIILAAGIFMNLVLGFVILFGLYGFQDYIPTTTVAKFAEEATSSQTGLQAEDTILSIDDSPVFTETDVAMLLMSATDGRADITVSRSGQRVELTDVQFPMVTNEDGSSSIALDFYLYSRPNHFFNAVEYAAKKFCTLTVMIWRSLGMLFTGQVGITELSGPIGVGQAVGQTLSYGADGVLLLTAFLTINVGIFNFLPIPALDGCQILFNLIELIIRRPIPQKYTSVINTVGLVLLFALMIFISCKDLLNLFG